MARPLPVIRTAHIISKNFIIIIYYYYYLIVTYI